MLVVMSVIEEYDGIVYRHYRDETDLRTVQNLFARELSEPYQLWTYRYFTVPWPMLTIFAEVNGEIVGCCMANIETRSRSKCTKLDEMAKNNDGSLANSSPTYKRGYIGMISVVDAYKRRKIGKRLYTIVLQEMRKFGVEVISLETESDNVSALLFYESLGFRKTRLFSNYYMNGKNAYRMVKWLVPNTD